jgi:hypothetical protein
LSAGTLRGRVDVAPADLEDFLHAAHQQSEMKVLSTPAAHLDNHNTTPVRVSRNVET